MAQVSCTTCTACASRRSAVPDVVAVCALLLGALSLTAYLVHGVMLERLGQRLSRVAGAQVTVGGLRAALSPTSIVIDDLKIGDILAVEQAAATLGLDHGRPTVKGLRLVRPALRLDLDRWPAPRRPRASRGRGRQRAATGRLPDVEVQDGSVSLTMSRFTLSSREVYLRSRGGSEATTRLILGPTQLELDGRPLVGISATATDLDPGNAFRPKRVAALGASVRLPSSPQSLVGIHRVSLVPVLDGYRLELEGKTAGRRTGRFTASCQLDGALRPERARVSLRQADLSALEPVLAPLGLRLNGTRVSGAVGLEREGEGGYRLRGRLAARELTVDHPLIGSRPVGPLDATLSGDIALEAGGAGVTVHRLRLATGSIDLDLGGSVQAGSAHTKLALDLTLAPLLCQDLLASLPPGFAPKLEGMAAEGEIGVKARLRLDTRDIEATDVNLALAPLTCRVLVDPPRADVRSLNGEVTIKVTGPRGRGMQWPLGPSNPDWAPLKRISPNVRSAFVVAEDGRFYQHKGFDHDQLRRAFVTNLEQGRLLRGASTISQQLIKNVFLSHRRTVSRKFQEAVLTWRLEQVISKRRILELYLNLVEMGPGVYGVAQAARHYFGRTARTVSPLQAAHLAALTPSPRHLGQRFRQGIDPGLAWTEKLNMLLRMMRRAGSISRAEQEHWSSERLSLLKDR